MNGKIFSKWIRSHGTLSVALLGILMAAACCIYDDETEEMVPGYYRLFIDLLLENGVIFDVPEFITL